MLIERRDQAPAVVKKFGKTGLWARMLGPGNRVRRHEMYGVRQMRGNRIDHSAFHRTDIRHGCPGFERWRDLCGDG